METNRFLIETGEAEIIAHLSKCLDPLETTYSFLAQTRVYAAKPKFHLRRTVKLDFVAEYFIYDMVYRERGRFRKPHNDAKRHFGYRFEGGAPLSPSASYKAFKGAISANEAKYKHSISFDVASSSILYITMILFHGWPTLARMMKYINLLDNFCKK